MSTPGLWYPPQWSKPAMVSITVAPPSSATTPKTVGDDGILTVSNPGPTTYVFDAVLSLEHEQRLTKTRHPVQTGADLSDHAYLEPADLVMYIGMSDAMAAYSSGQTSPVVTPFSGNPSKSVSAYLQMISLQAARQPLTITTRLRTYYNMVVAAVSPREDHKTIASLKMRVSFEQINTAAIVTQPDSARPQDTDSTGLGQVNSLSPSAATVNQFNVDDIQNSDPPDGTLSAWLLQNPSGVNVPGAGDYSSVNTTNLQQLAEPM